MSSQSMVDLKVCINGNSVATFQHENKIFVEGREGTEYALRVSNPHSFRVKIVLSVDGVNVISGKPASGAQEETGYILNAGESQTILGYRLDDTSVARFKFAKAEGSYAQAEVGLKETTGVIGCRAYREKAAPAPVIIKEVHHHHDWYDRYYGRPFFWNGSYTTNIPPRDNGIPIGESFSTNGNNTTFATSNERGAVRTMSFDACFASAAQSSVQCSAQQSLGIEEAPFALGSTFGQKTESRVESVAFVTDVFLGEISIFYSTRAGLTALGVDVTRKPKVAFPSAFDGAYCKAPKGWTG